MASAREHAARRRARRGHGSQAIGAPAHRADDLSTPAGPSTRTPNAPGGRVLPARSLLGRWPARALPRRARSVSLVIALGVLGLAGCLEPLVSDELVGPTAFLAPGSDVPSVLDDPALAAQIAAHDGVDGDIVPLLSGFHGGEPVRYWDFGPSPAAAVPIFLIARESPSGPFAIDGVSYAPVPGHGGIIDAVPGDPGYSPFWSVFVARVTPAWDGEIFPSVAAVEEGIAAGLLEPPRALPMVVNCPVVLPHVLLEVSTAFGDVDYRGPEPGYYRGRVVYYFSFEALPYGLGGLEAPPAYVLRREGGEPLSEPLRGVDMTGSGDLRGTNNLFLRAPGEAGYTGLVELVEVVVPRDYGSIDTYGDRDRADIMDAAELFTGAGAWDPAQVVAAYPRAEIRNWPIEGEGYGR